MIIHRVEPGESLYSIGQATSSSTGDIVTLNGLQSETQIVPGLHLLLPGTRPVLTSAANNKRTIEVNGYLIPSGIGDATQVQEVGENLTYVCIFSYQARSDGSLSPQPDSPALSAARGSRVRPLVTVTNFDGNNFNSDLAHTLLSDNALRGRLISNIVNTASSRGYHGVNVDFEHMYPYDRPLYNSFIRVLASALHARGMSISIAMGPKTSDAPEQSWMGAFDYRALGMEVDFLMLMTYEWGWVGGPPMIHRHPLPRRFGQSVHAA